MHSKFQGIESCKVWGRMGGGICCFFFGGGGRLIASEAERVQARVRVQVQHTTYGCANASPAGGVHGKTGLWGA